MPDQNKPTPEFFTAPNRGSEARINHEVTPENQPNLDLSHDAYTPPKTEQVSEESELGTHSEYSDKPASVVPSVNESESTGIHLTNEEKKANLNEVITEGVDMNNLGNQMDSILDSSAEINNLET